MVLAVAVVVLVKKLLVFLNDAALSSSVAADVVIHFHSQHFALILLDVFLGWA